MPHPSATESPTHSPVRQGLRASPLLLALVGLFACGGGGSRGGGGTITPAITSADLVAVLPQLAPYATGHTLSTRSGGQASPQQPGAVAAAADSDAGAIRLSTGSAELPLLSVDLLGDGRPDATVFELDLDVPADAASLRMDLGFSTAEIDGLGELREDDRAQVLRLGGSPAEDELLLELRAATRSAAVGGSVPLAIDVQGLDDLRLRFVVEDAEDGERDSELVVSNAFFSPAEPPSTALSPRDQVNVGDEVDGDSTFGDPIVLTSGAYTTRQPLIEKSAVPLSFHLDAHYDSRRAQSFNELDQPLGPGWTHTYNGYLVLRDGEKIAYVHQGNGGKTEFRRDGSVYRPARSSVHTTLERRTVGADDEFVFERRDRVRHVFRGSGTRWPLVRVEDPNGNSLTLRYSFSGTEFGDGNPLTVDKITDSRGNEARFRYANGLLEEVRFGNFDEVDSGESVSVGFLHGDVDAPTLLTGLTGPDGRTRRFRYLNDDPQKALLTHIVQSSGDTLIRNEYEGPRVVRQVDALFRRSEVVYPDAASAETRTIDRSGHVQSRTFSDERDIVSWRDELGAEWTFTYDEDHNETSETDPLGGSTELSYDDEGHLVERVDALGHRVTWRYEAGDLVSTTDELGHTTTFEYDDRHNLIREHHPLGLFVEYEVDAAGRMTLFRDGRGNETRYAYTEKGDLATIADPVGGVLHHEVDDFGRRVLTTDDPTDPARGTRTTFDEAGRELVVASPVETIEKSYDANGRVSELRRVRDPLDPGDDVVSSYRYDRAGRLVDLIDPAGVHHVSSYDPEGRLASNAVALEAPDEKTPLDPLQHSVFEYDAAGRMVTARARLLDGEGTEAIARARYDANGQRTSLVDPLGGTTRFEFDALGQLVSETDPLGNVTCNEYDPTGALAAIVNARGQRIAYNNDALGRLETVSLPGDSASFVHDAAGNPVATFGPGGASILREFDAGDREVRRTDGFGATVAREFDLRGNRTTLVYPDGCLVRYRYDAADRLISVEDWAGRKTGYGYDDYSREPTRMTRPDGSKWRSRRDALGRVVELEDRGPTGELLFRATYTYDAIGRRTGARIEPAPEIPLPVPGTRRFLHNAGHRLVSADGEAFAWDADGNLRSGVFGGERHELEFDELNRLVRLDDVELAYDADGLRVEIRDPGGSPAVRRFVYDVQGEAARLLEERDGSDAVIARYVHGLGLLYREDAAGNLSVYHYDSRGSTVALTAADGRVTDRYAYGPYGRCTHEGETPENPFTYVGEHGVVDDRTGLLFMRSRYYAPELMRFVQKDPRRAGTLMRPQSLAPYAYVNGDPILGIDPEGEFGVFGAIAGAVVNVVVEASIDLIVDGELGGWESYAGAAVEGAIIGSTGGIGGFVAGAVAGDLTTQLLQVASSGATYDPFQTLQAGGAALVAGKVADAKLLRKANKLLKRGKARTPRSRLQDTQARLAREAAGVASSKSFQKTFRRMAPAGLKQVRNAGLLQGAKRATEFARSKDFGL